MKRSASPGFFALGRFLGALKRVEPTGRVIPATDVTENNAIEAYVLGCLVFGFWVLVVDSALGRVPWMARIPLALLTAFVFIQWLTVVVAFMLERALVVTGKVTAAGTRAMHTSGHVVLIICLCIYLVITRPGTAALGLFAWGWLALAGLNAVAACAERRG